MWGDEWAGLMEGGNRLRPHWISIGFCCALGQVLLRGKKKRTWFCEAYVVLEAPIEINYTKLLIQN